MKDGHLVTPTVTKWIEVPIPNAQPFIKLAATHTLVDTVFGPAGHRAHVHACPMCWTLKVTFGK